MKIMENCKIVANDETDKKEIVKIMKKSDEHDASDENW